MADITYSWSWVYSVFSCSKKKKSLSSSCWRVNMFSICRKPFYWMWSVSKAAWSIYVSNDLNGTKETYGCSSSWAVIGRRRNCRALPSSTSSAFLFNSRLISHHKFVQCKKICLSMKSHWTFNFNQISQCRNADKCIGTSLGDLV